MSFPSRHLVVDWIETAGYYGCLHVGSDTHVMRRTLLELEKDLGGESFIRIHRSLIVTSSGFLGWNSRAQASTRWY